MTAKLRPGFCRLKLSYNIAFSILLHFYISSAVILQTGKRPPTKLRLYMCRGYLSKKRKFRQPIASDVDILEKIRAYLILHLDKPPSVTELSKMFMLNEKKLKQDFK